MLVLHEPARLKDTATHPLWWILYQYVLRMVTTRSNVTATIEIGETTADNLGMTGWGRERHDYPN